MLRWQRNLHQGLHNQIAMGEIGVAMVEIGAETIIEMGVLLVLIGGIIIVGIAHAHTKASSLNVLCTMNWV